jgi:hypothetical protein
MKIVIEMVARKVMAARCAEDVFGADQAAVAKNFRSMALVLHPDHAGTDADAAAAMRKLLELRDEAEKKVAQGTWGKNLASAGVEIRAKYVYKNVAPLKAGDLTDLYVADYEDGKPRRAVLKMLREPRDEDLATAEWKNLARLWSKTEERDVHFQHYLPHPVETVKVTISGKLRRANILRFSAGRHTIAEVLTAYPRGLDPRDMAWMWRRLLEVISWIHASGIVHGAVLPEHVLIGAANHSIKLVGWSYSVDIGQKIKAVPSTEKKWYPPEVLAKLPATEATDVFMAARLALALCGDDLGRLPRKIGSLLSACLLQNPRSRHSSAVAVYKRFDDVLRDLYGPPAFRTFEML